MLLKVLSIEAFHQKTSEDLLYIEKSIKGTGVQSGKPLMLGEGVLLVINL